MKFPGIFIALSKPDKKTLDGLDQQMREYTAQAARGECHWICSSCGAGFPEGMPDKCLGNLEWCTATIQRDKAEASK